MLRRVVEGLHNLKEVMSSSYIEDDNQFLATTDKLFFEQLQSRLPEIRTTLEPFSSHLTELGSGVNPVRLLGLKQFRDIQAIDPAYQWYEHEPSDPFEAPPYPAGVYGGKESKKRLAAHVRTALSSVVMPTAIMGDQTRVIEGKRHGERVTVTLVPQPAIEWLTRQPQGSLPAVCLYRVFPSLESWKLVLSRLQPGGLLVTTGEGVSQWDGEGIFSLGTDAFSGGADITDSPLPANKHWQKLGITPLFPEMKVPYFYRKE
jgi:hypothetical protein